MKRGKKRLLSAILCLAAAALLLSPLTAVLAGGVPGEDSIIHGSKTDSTGDAWLSSGKLLPADWYSKTYLPEGYYPTPVILDLSQGVTRSLFGTAPLREGTDLSIDGVCLFLVGADCDTLTAYAASALDGGGRDYWPYQFEPAGYYGYPEDPYHGRNPGMAEVCRTEGLGTRIFQFVSDAHMAGGSTTVFGDGSKWSSEGGLVYPGGFQRRLAVTRSEGEEDAHYEGGRQDSRYVTEYGVVDVRDGEEIMGEFFVSYSLICNCTLDIRNLSYRGDAVCADVDGHLYMKHEIKEYGKLNGETRSGPGLETYEISGKQLPFTAYQDTVNGEAMMYLEAGEVTLYFWVAGVHVSTEYTNFFQEEETDAKDTPGEDDGTVILPGIIDDPDGGPDGGGPEGGKPDKGGKPSRRGVRNAFFGLLPAFGGAIAVKNRRGKKNKTYKMKIYKEFGDTILPGQKLPVYARIVEIVDGAERDRPELSKDIVIRNHDEVFLTELQDGLVDNYKCAMVEVSPGQEISNKGDIDFIYEGKGGTFINRVTFKVKMPEIIFYQPNMALVAGDERGGTVCFTVEGLDPEKTKIALEFTEGASYAAAAVQAETEEGEPIPGTYFACLGDINEDPGPAGTYAVHTLQIRATDGSLSAAGSFEIYRVAAGLSVGAELINCFRFVKPEAANKQVDELQDSDFGMSYTEAPVMLVKVDEEAQRMYYEPAFPKFRFEPLEPEDGEMRERLEALGLEAAPVEKAESVAVYAFCCKKGWLEAPARLKVRLVAEYTDPKTGQQFTCTKPVLLLSQPIREQVSISQLEEDDRTREMLYQLQDVIEQEPRLMNLMFGDVVLITNMRLGYHEKFGYDPLTLATIQKDLARAIHILEREDKQKEQEWNLKYDETVKADSSFLSIVSKSLAMTSEEYLDTWPGILLRIGFAVGSGGLSEFIFTPLDVNKAIVDYNESRLLCDRSWKGQLIAGATPVAISLGIGLGFKYGAKAIYATAKGTAKYAPRLVRAVVPRAIRNSAGKWAIGAKNAVKGMIPEKWISFANGLREGAGKRIGSIRQGFRDIGQGMKELAQDINAHDPRKYLNDYRKSIIKTSADNTAAKKLALMEGEAALKGPRTTEGLLMDKFQAVGELEATRKLDRFKKAWEWFQRDPVAARREFVEAGEALQKSPLAINALNADGKTAAQIAAKAEVRSSARAGYNYFKKTYCDDPMLPLMKQKAAKVAGVPEKNVSVIRATGKSERALGEGFSCSADTDNALLITDPKTGTKHYMSQTETTGIVAESYCEGTGKAYETTAEALQHSNKANVVGIGSESPELYGEFGKFKTSDAFSKQGIAKNMRTSQYKMSHGLTEMENGIRKIAANPSETERLMKECDDFLAGKTMKLSGKTAEGVELLETGFDGVHQCPKTFDLYAAKDYHAQALGMKSGFSQQSRVTAETFRLVENPGPNRITVGQMNDLLKSRGSSFKKASADMVLEFQNVNTGCQAANDSLAGRFMNMNPGSGADGGAYGIGGAAGSRWGQREQ